MTPDPVGRLLARARRRLAAVRALRGAVAGSWLALAPVAAWAMAARIFALPDLVVASALALALAPLLGALGSVLRGSTESDARRLAGHLVRSPALFLAQASPAATRLAPLVGDVAFAAARTSDGAAWGRGRPARGLRALPLPLLLTVLLLAAPGRRAQAPDTATGIAGNLAAEQRHVASAVRQGRLSPEQRAAAQRALRELETAGLDPDRARDALAVLRRMAREAGGDADLLSRRLQDDALLGEVAQAMGSADPEALERALGRLIERLRTGRTSARERNESSILLQALAADVGNSGLADRLRALARSLGSGSGEEAGEALAQAGKLMAPVPPVVRDLETFVVLLEDVAGRGGTAGAGVGSHDSASGRPTPATGRGSAPVLAASGVEQPRHEIILRRYFDR